MTRPPFSDLDGTPANHFRLLFFAALSHLLAVAKERAGSWSALVDRFPFVVGYRRELQACGVLETASTPAAVTSWWRNAIAEWERSAPGFLPVRALRSVADLDGGAITLLFLGALPEEDARFAILFESLHGREGRARPTVGLLLECAAATGQREDGRRAIQQLQQVGLLRVVNPEAPRLHWELEPPAAVWDALRSESTTVEAPWFRHIPAESLVSIEDLILPDALRPTVARLPSTLSAGDVATVVVRGPRHCGRHTLLGSAARSLGRGVLHVGGGAVADETHCTQLGVLATVLCAMPVVAVDPAPGASVTLPPLRGYDGPLGVVCGRYGGVSTTAAEPIVSISLDIPDAASRRRHWLSQLDAAAFPDIDRVSEQVRMTGGNIRRTAGLARATATLGGRQAISAADVRQAARTLSREALDTLAAHVSDIADWGRVAVRDETLRDLLDLEMRCRHRERLSASATGDTALASGPGVRALFRGPSGTGKTLAARVLAGVLEMDLYRLDLSTLVDKYIGETEKNLDRVLSRAEELDVMLLLDEGDALLTQRTSVQSSNDRYANLETNYLLQRLESFEGILIVTTNAGDRIDAAFERRMDVVVDFRQAEAQERWEIWRLHLPEPNAVDSPFLTEVARRCVLSGGQIRNAALYATLHALDRGGLVTTSMLEAAIRREYRKAGAVCPLRQSPDLAFAGM